MSERAKIYVFAGLLVLLALVTYFFAFNRSPVPGLTGVLAADAKFQPLDVQEPGLRVDELVRLRKQEYSGSHRNIFLAAPAPIPKPAGASAAPAFRFVGPRLPPPPPPLQVPAEFFGYASQPHSGKRVAFFTSNDDVLVVAEGDKFLNNYRLIHIGNDSAEVEEISSGRRASVALVQPPTSTGPPGPEP
jgi:hypothetical protein